MQPLKTKDSRPIRLSMFTLQDVIAKCGWDMQVCNNTDYPYNTKYFKFIPRVRSLVVSSRIVPISSSRETRMFDSEDMKILLFGFGYFDIDIDYKNHFILVYA